MQPKIAKNPILGGSRSFKVIDVGTIGKLVGGVLEPNGSKLTPLKSTFNAEHFVRRLSWSILNGFGAIQS